MLGDVAEIAQRTKSARPHDSAGRFADDAEYAADAARLVAHRIVRHVEVRLFDIAVPLHEEWPILCPERFAGGEHTVEDLLQAGAPQLIPGFANWPAQRTRVLGAEHRSVSIVIERDQLLSPEERDLRLGWQQDAECASQALRPCLDGAERRCRPVELSDESPHLAAADDYARDA